MARKMICLAVASTLLAPVAVTAQIPAPMAVKLAEAVRARDAQTLADQIAISEIPAPPFAETKRGEDFAARLRAIGLNDVKTDATGNVIAVRRGVGKGPRLILSAHLDTVFPAGTDVKVRKDGVRYKGPGLADDARGLSALLTIATVMEAAKVRTVGDIVFVGTVGEEGAGDLRGARALVAADPMVDGFISIDGTGTDRITTGATGSRRWKLRFKGPGGHSFGNFGRPSAIHAMGRAIALMADLDVPTSPKTTYNVGVISGGTSVNAIAEEAVLDLDMRSNDPAALKALEEKALAAADAGAFAEGTKRGGKIVVERTLTGDRPSGQTPTTSPIVTAMNAAYAALGEAMPTQGFSSTDSNIAISRGIPAVTLGGGGTGGNAHSLEEYYEPTRAWVGPQLALIAALGMVGVEGGPPPQLPVRSTRK